RHVRARPDVQVEAVFAHADAFGQERDVAAIAAVGLDAHVAELGRAAHTVPLPHRLRLAPAQVTDGRCRERNAAELANAGRRLDAAAQAARVELHGLGDRCNGAR